VLLSGDLESMVESARFLLLLSKLYQRQNRYDDRLSFMIRAKEVQDRSALLCICVCVQGLLFL